MDKSVKPVLGYILKGYPRISETFISNEILRLEELGFIIQIFPMRHPRENFCHDSVKKIQAEVHYLPTHLFQNFFTLALPNLRLFAKHPNSYTRALTLAIKRFGRTRKTATFKHLFQAGYMAQKFLLKENKVTHLHGHFAHSPTSVTMFASMLTGIPFSFTGHAKDIYTSNSEQLKEKINKASFVFTCTRYNKEYLNKIAAYSNTPIHCVYHGIDINLFHTQNDKTETAPPYKLLTVARLTEKKGLPTIYAALAKLKAKGVQFQHTLIGDGDDREKIDALIEELQLQDVCLRLGTQTHQEVLHQFKESDVFILGCKIASNGDRDGIPNVLVESLAMGVPAISTNVSAIPELIKNGKTGLIVHPENSDELAEAIETMVSDMKLRSTVIQEGRKFVKDYFDNRKLIHNMADIFENNYSNRPH